MWKAVAGIVIGVLVGIFLVPELDAKKKQPKENPKVEARINIDDDGVARWIHICCDCALTHYVEMKNVYSLGLDGRRCYGIEMMWVVDSDMTRDNRIKKWGPFWDRQNDPFSAERGMNREDKRW